MRYKEIIIEIPVSTDLDDAKRKAIFECLKNQCKITYFFNDIRYSVKYDDVIKQVK